VLVAILAKDDDGELKRGVRGAVFPGRGAVVREEGEARRSRSIGDWSGGAALASALDAIAKVLTAATDAAAALMPDR
jgi:hypothetical protein